MPSQAVFTTAKQRRNSGSEAKDEPDRKELSLSTSATAPFSLQSRLS